MVLEVVIVSVYGVGDGDGECNDLRGGDSECIWSWGDGECYNLQDGNSECIRSCRW